MRARAAARPRATRGFTLVELMATLALSAIVVLLAVPSFAQAVARHRLQAAAEQLALDLAEARQQAAQRGTVLHLSFNGGAQWCYALAAAPGCDCRTDSACSLKTVASRDYPGVQLLQAEDARIEPRPGASSGGSALLQGAAGQALRVTLGPLGRARVCAPAGPSGNYPGC